MSSSFRVPSITLLAEANKSAVDYFGKQFQPVPLYVRSEAHSDVFIVEKRNGGSGVAVTSEASTPSTTTTNVVGAVPNDSGAPLSTALFAVKRQYIGKERAGPHDSMLVDRAYRELRMLLQLSQLRAESRCSHFVALLEHAKSKPPLLFPGHCEPDDVFMYYVLEYAAADLHSLRAKAPQYRAARRPVVVVANDAAAATTTTTATAVVDAEFDSDFDSRPLSQSTGATAAATTTPSAALAVPAVTPDGAVNERLFRMRAALFDVVSSVRGFATITFQLIWALACAQKQYSFVHNDLHMKNVLLCVPGAGEVCQAYLDDSNQCWYTEGVLVKVTDFGLSRITLAATSEVLYNTNNSFSELFDATRDLVELSQHLPSLRKAVLADAEVSDDDSRLWRSFLAAMRRAPNAKVLLSHEYFDVLRQRSPFVAMDNTLFMCFNGAKDVPRFRRHVRCLINGEPLDADDTIGAADLTEVARLQATDVHAGVRAHELGDGSKTLRSQRRAELAPQYVLHAFTRKPAAPRKATPAKRKYKKKRKPRVGEIAEEKVEEQEEVAEEEEEEEEGLEAVEVVDDEIELRTFKQARNDAWSDLDDEPAPVVVSDLLPAGPIVVVAASAVSSEPEERRLSKNKESFRSFRDFDTVLQAVARRTSKE